jgi:uncharacterized membrane protein
MWTLLLIPIEPGSHLFVQMNAVIKRLPVNQFILARAPESFDEDVVMTLPAPVHLL